jgi:aminocarboxymuconate-semialdehyde decarboxylase
MPEDPAAPWPTLRLDSEREATIMVGSTEFRAIESNCWSADDRRADMDADGVDVQVVSPTPVFFSYDRPAEHGMAISRIFNDLTLEICDADRARFIPFCQVPLQDPDLACEELDRCLDAGHVGVEIGNHVGDRDLDDPGIVSFLQHCAEVGAPVFVHPWDMPETTRTERWMGRWTVGMPAETHTSLVAMIFGGAFDQLPRDLRICFAHGAGSFVFWLGRLENAWHRRPKIRGASAYPPSRYLDRFYVDSTVFDERALRLLVDTMGRDRVVLGSDYPYPLGERPVGAVVEAAGYLDDAARHAIRGGNALRWLGLELQLPA